MPLPPSGPLSFSQLKSTYGVTGTSCSFSQLVRGGSFVDNSKNIEVTDAISSVSDTGYGNGGYNQRYNVGNLNTSSTATGYYGGAFPFQYGYLINNQGASANIQNGSASFINNGAEKNTTYDSIMSMFGSSNTGQTKSFVHNITFARAGTYYIWGFDLDGFGTIAVSGANSGNISATGGMSTAYSLKTTIGVSANQTVTITYGNYNERINFGFNISTSSTQAEDKTLNVLINQNVPNTANNIALSDYYEGDGG